MNRVGQSDAGRWTIATVVAIAGAGLVIALFCGPQVTVAAPRRPSVPPILVRGDNGIDAVFDEQKALTDPTPLFLPTKWNAEWGPIVRPEPGATFENYKPEYVVPSLGEGLKLNFPNSERLVTTAVDALGDAPGPLLAGIGRSAEAPRALSERGAFVEIVADGTGQVVWRQPLVEARPPGEGAWQPLEFFAHVNAMGLAGPLVPTRRSGAEGVDDYFQRYLVQTLRVGQRLAPGFYRISVGP